MAAYKSRTTTAKSPDVTVLGLEDFDVGDDIVNQRIQTFLNSRPDGFHRQVPLKNRSSKYKGVSLKRSNRCRYLYWQASIHYKYRTISIKLFPHTGKGEKMAALAYDKTAKELFGGHALTNQEYFPEDFI